MNQKIQERFLQSAAVILFVTAIAKLLSAAGSSVELEHHDPILVLTNRHVFILVAIIELALSAFLLISRHRLLGLLLVAWLATNFLVYRAGLHSVGAPAFCNCIGSYNRISLSPFALNLLLLVALGWLLAGSYAGLILEWLARHRRPAAAPPQPAARQTTVSA